MLHIKSVVKSLGNFLLGPLDLIVENEILVILGPSGSGKTTLINVISGISQLDSGEIIIGNERVSEESIENRGVSIVFQEDALFPHMTVLENIKYANSTEEDINKNVDIFGIEHILDRSVGALSGGEKNRVELARAIISMPKILLLDEPLSSLDYPVRKKLAPDLRKILKRVKIPVVYVTHDREIAWEIGDRIAIMSKGGICQIGTPEDVFKKPTAIIAAEITGESNILRMEMKEKSGNERVVGWGPYNLEIVAEQNGNEETIHVSIRPDDIILGTQGGGINWMEGEIIEKIFKGHRYAVELNIEGVEENIRVNVPLDHNEIKNL